MTRLEQISFIEVRTVDLRADANVLEFSNKFLLVLQQYVTRFDRYRDANITRILVKKIHSSQSILKARWIFV